MKHDSSYEFVVAESLPLNAQRVWQTTVVECTDFLGKRTNTGIHEARKRLKKLRAVLVLVARGIGKDTRRELDKTLQSCARSVGAVRDASSMVECAERLQQGGFGGAAALAEILAKRREEIKSRTHEDLEEVSARVLQVQLQLPLLRDESFATLSAGIADAFDVGRAAYRVCEARGASPEEFHNLRKRTKTLWYLLCMLYVYWPAVMHPLKEEWKGVCDVLGHHHDLAVLRDVVLEEHLLAEEPLHDFLDAAEKQLTAFETDILRTTRLLYAQGFHRQLEAAFDVRKGKE